MERAGRVQLLVGIGRWRVLGIGALLSLVTPIGLLPLLLVLVLSIDLLLVSRRMTEAREIVSEFERLEQSVFEAMVRRARRPWRGSLHARMVRAGAEMLRTGRDNDCRDGHVTGCAHRPVSWPASVELAASRPAA